MLFNEFLRSNIILSMICEDINLEDESMLINQALLGEDESPIDIINKIDSKNTEEVKKESDETVEDIFSTLDIDSLVDKLEAEEEQDEEDAERISLKINDTSSNKLRLNIQDSDDEEVDNVVNLKIKKHPKDELKVNIKEPDIMKQPLKVEVRDDDDNNKEDELKVVINDKVKSGDINVKVNDNKEDNADFKVNINNNSSTSGDINLKLKNNKEDLPIGDGDIKVRLKNVSTEPEDKVSSFINRRDELLSTNNPNLQLTTCLKIIINLKKSLERLVTYIPNENVLAQTKYLVGDILDNLMDNSTIILSTPEKMKKIIYKIFDMLLSINKYIENKYHELEDKLDNTTKKQEDEDIDKSSHNVDVINAFKEVAKTLGVDTEDGTKDFLEKESSKPIDDNKNDKDGKIKPIPNINKKRI